MRRFIDSLYAIIFRAGESLGSLSDKSEGLINRLLELPGRIVGRNPDSEFDDGQLRKPEHSRFAATYDWFVYDVLGAAGAAVLGFGRRLVPHRVLGWIAELVFWLLDFFAYVIVESFSAVAGFVRRLLPEWLSDPLFAIFDLGSLLGDFFSDWWWTRDLRTLLKASPAILMAAPLAVVLVLAPLYSMGGKKVQHYRTALQDAIDGQDEARESLSLQKLRQLGYQKLEGMEFQSALALAEQDRYEEAYAAMQKLTPSSEPGFLNAHIWIADAAFQGRIEKEDSWPTVESHVDQALQIDPRNVAAKRIKVEVLLNRDEFAEAAKQMAELVGQFPDLHAEIVHFTKDIWADAERKRHARKAIAYSKELLEEGGQLAHWTMVARIAECYEVVADPAGEFEFRYACNTLFPDEPKLSEEFQQALTRMAGEVEFSDAHAKPLLRYRFTQQPNEMDVIAKLANAIVQRDPAALSIAKECETEGILPALVYKLVGDHYLVAKKHSAALPFYLRSCKIDGSQANSWNNIAWLLSVADPPDLDRALQAANRAVKLSSDSRVLETRGQIFLQMKRFKEAARDYETSLNAGLAGAVKQEVLQGVYRKLAEIYDLMGNDEQAAAYRQMIAGT